MSLIIPTIHPAYLLRQGKPVSDVIQRDLLKAWRVAHYGWEHPENLVIVHPTNPFGVAQAVQAGTGWLERWKSLRCPVAVDIETSALDFFACRLYSIAISGLDGYNTAVAFTLNDLRTLPWDAESLMVSTLKRLLADENVTKIYHNSPFDKAVLTIKGFEINGPTEDTQGFAHLIQPDIPKDLGWIGHTYLDVEPWKLHHETGKKNAFTEDVVELLVYNAKDALNTMKLRNPLIQEIYNRGMNQKLISYQMAFADLASDMEIFGIPINREKRAKMGKELADRLALLKHEMREYLNWPDFNPMAKRHVTAALYDKKYLGLTPTKFTAKSNEPSTKYEDLIDYMEHPFCKKLIEYVEERHCWSTQYKDSDNDKEKGGSYYKAFARDGRMHVKWNATGTKGSRQSSQPNIQNQKVRDRAWIEAGPGRVLIGADKDQLELRIAACRSGVRELLEEMAKPDGDPHTLAAINVYGEGFLKKEKSERKKLRDAVKTTVYASLYRAGKQTVWRTIRKKKFLPSAMRSAMTLPVVSHIYDSYFGKYVEIPMWHDKNLMLASTQGYLEIPPLGRRRYFPVQPPPFTEVGSWPTQTIGSDFVTMEMVHIQQELKSKFKDASIFIHAHDALYIECWEKDAEAIARIVNNEFGRSILEGPAGNVMLTAEAKIGRDLIQVK